MTRCNNVQAKSGMHLLNEEIAALFVLVGSKTCAPKIETDRSH